MSIIFQEIKKLITPVESEVNGKIASQIGFKYVKLPDSLVLLFHDMFGQILLLLFAILVGSYSFLCGVLLVILFISIMMQTKTESFEGFIGSPDSDMALNNLTTTSPIIYANQQELAEHHQFLKLIQKQSGFVIWEDKDKEANYAL